MPETQVAACVRQPPFAKIRANQLIASYESQYPIPSREGWRGNRAVGERKTREASPESFRGYPPGFRVLNWSADFQIGRFKSVADWRRIGVRRSVGNKAVQTIFAGAVTISVHGRQKILFIKRRGGSKTVTMISYCERR